MSLSEFSQIFRPTDEHLSSRQKSKVEVDRLLFVLGAILCLVFIFLFDLSDSEATDPTWARLVVTGLLAGVFVASYLSKQVRTTYGTWVQGTVYVITGWFILITALNGFASDYEIGLLLLHAMFMVIVGIGARSIRPILWFAGISLLGTIGAVVGSQVSLREEAVLLGSMGTASLVLSITMQRLISVGKKLEDRESRLRGLANSTPGVVYQFFAREDGSRGTYFVSEHAQEVLGISPDPEDFYERFVKRVPRSHRQDLLDSIEEVIQDRRSWQFEIPFEKPSGERIWLLGTSTPDVRENEIVFNGLLLDISERKKAENRLREAKREAEEASRVKTAMLANMSHEVRTPLTTIVGFSEVLKDNLKGRMQKFARRIHESGRRLSKTLKSILQLSKLEAGVARLDREDVFLVEVVEDTVEALHPRAEEKSITVRRDFPDRSVCGRWNQNAIRRIYRNLLENAIKFTPEDGHVDVRVRKNGTEATLEVEDSGIGIREENIPHIFQAFRQESEGLRREYQGSGLGLSIVQHLVDELQGTVDVETEKGEGTLFRVRLPLRPEKNAGTS